MKLLTALAITAVMFASSASAADPDDLQKLKDTGNCIGCNLESANLKGAYLFEAYLFESELGGADLRKANLDGANLRDANLSYAIMMDAILCNTTMPDGSVIYSGC